MIIQNNRLDLAHCVDTHIARRDDLSDLLDPQTEYIYMFVVAFEHGVDTDLLLDILSDRGRKRNAKRRIEWLLKEGYIKDISQETDIEFIREEAVKTMLTYRL